MTKKLPVDNPIDAVAALAEPTRRALYDLVVADGEAVGRDDAVEVLGISRELAAFHLDRLVEAGLLQAEYRRRSGRTGPGAGRPAKLYRRTDRQVEISFPARRYDRAADLMATAMEMLPGTGASDALSAVARERGIAVGVNARQQAGRRLGHARTLGGVVEVLRTAGYEPWLDAPGTVCLRNCPYDELAAEHRDLTCGMNLAWAEGVVDGLGASEVRVELDPEPGRCCLIFHADSGPPGESSTAPNAGTG